MVNMQQAASQLMDIAKSAYGSGIFEGSKGGNGYVGQYTDANGTTHTVKVLTHRNERKDFANAATRGDTEHLAAATKQLKENLIAIANGTNVNLGNRIRALLDNAQQQAVQEKMTVGKEGGEQVGLLSRKIVAKAITTIANEGKIADFSWDDVAKNRAKTETDSTTATVNAKVENEAAKQPAVQNQNQPVQNQNPPEKPKINVNNKHAEAVKNERDMKKLWDLHEKFFEIETRFQKNERSWRSKIPNPEEREVKGLHDERRTIYPFDLIANRYDDLKNRIKEKNGDVIATIKEFCEQKTRILGDLKDAIELKDMSANLQKMGEAPKPKVKLSIVELMDKNKGKDILDSLDVEVMHGDYANFDTYADVMAVRLILEEARHAEMGQFAKNMGLNLD